MKKKIFFYGILSLLALVLAGCSSDDDPKPGFDMELLYGKWRVTHVQRKDGSMYDVTTPEGEAVFEPTYATFRKDGTYYGKGYFGTGSGTYKVKGNTIICYIEGSEYFRYDVISVKEKTAILEMYKSDQEGRLRIRCMKVG